MSYVQYTVVSFTEFGILQNTVLDFFTYHINSSGISITNIAIIVVVAAVVLVAVIVAMVLLVKKRQNHVAERAKFSMSSSEGNKFTEFEVDENIIQDLFI